MRKINGADVCKILVVNGGGGGTGEVVLERWYCWWQEVVVSLGRWYWKGGIGSGRCQHWGDGIGWKALVVAGGGGGGTGEMLILEGR